MQSQQKRVKWSRGETAEALEERTDTGITSASVELMKNCIPDIYGNISRRPGIVSIRPASPGLIADLTRLGFNYDEHLQVIPFYITEDDIILVGIHSFLSLGAEFIRIKNNELVALAESTTFCPHTIGTGTGDYDTLSYTQQNNYMLIADRRQVYKLQISFGTGNTFTPVFTAWPFSAGWYAPDGTKTKRVNNITGLAFSGHISNVVFANTDGSSSVYSELDTGLSGGRAYTGTWNGTADTFYLGMYTVRPGEVYLRIKNTVPDVQTFCSWNMVVGQTYSNGETLVQNGNYKVVLDIKLEADILKASFVAYENTTKILTKDESSSVTINTVPSVDAIESQIPLGSIIQLPNIGSYFRVEKYTLSNSNLIFTNYIFDGVLNYSDTIPSVGLYCFTGGDVLTGDVYFTVYRNGSSVENLTVAKNGAEYIVQNNASTSGFSKITAPNPNLWGEWEDADPTTLEIKAIGELLTPVADENATDSDVSVEYGFISLTPSNFTASSIFPHPMKLVFNAQRLWAGSWQYDMKNSYCLVVGSQIARYTDFKNDYNQENEAITLDILTNFKEKIVHLIDYNGLKIMTNSYEYAYDGTNGVVKQSANGALEDCEPLIFDSLCLYVDTTGQQVKAMQYEFQSNIFNSSTINQVAPHDLVWYPVALAAYEDKTNSTGKYLFVMNTLTSSNPTLAVCNFVPSNQANIWSRWAFKQSEYSTFGIKPLLYGVVHTKKEPIFLLAAHQFRTERGSGTTAFAGICIVPAVIDFNAIGDAVGYLTMVDTGTGETTYRYELMSYHSGTTYKDIWLTLPNTQVVVYDGSEYKWTDTTTSTGMLTKSLSSLTSPDVGLPINSTIVSHPIDVGGKTKSIKKRIGKARMSVHGTDAGVITINGKTGYMNPAKDTISFYGVSGMKNEIKYTITNKNGGMFHLESLLMNIEYGTLDS